MTGKEATNISRYLRIISFLLRGIDFAAIKKRYDEVGMDGAGDSGPEAVEILEHPHAVVFIVDELQPMAGDTFGMAGDHFFTIFMLCEIFFVPRNRTTITVKVL